MKNVNDFWINKKQGDIGEAIVSRWLAQHGFRYRYDQTEDRKHHVDRICTKDDQSFTLDVKHDYTIGKSNNIAFETVSNCQKNSPGWGQCENNHAEYIFITDGKQETLEHPQFWIFRLKDQQEFYGKHMDTQKHYYNYRNGQKVGEFKLIPIKDFGTEFSYYHVDTDWKCHCCGNKDKVWKFGDN